MVIRGMNLPLIIACTIIVLALIIFPLMVSYNAEKKNEQNKDDIPVAPRSEWDKIREYGNQVNKKTKDSK
jgi:hypothetical protein